MLDWTFTLLASLERPLFLSNTLPSPLRLHSSPTSVPGTPSPCPLFLSSSSASSWHSLSQIPYSSRGSQKRVVFINNTTRQLRLLAHSHRLHISFKNTETTSRLFQQAFFSSKWSRISSSTSPGPLQPTTSVTNTQDTKGVIAYCSRLPSVILFTIALLLPQLCFIKPCLLFPSVL